MQNKSPCSGNIMPQRILETPAARRGWINHILLQSFVDGPGNRTVIFLQGCNLHCLYCHNPYTLAVCNHCGLCVDTCPSGALLLANGRVNWKLDLCTECDTCIQTCPNNSSPRAIQMSAEELWHKIMPSAGFVSGVTISGGEPVLQADFIDEFFTIVKKWSSLTTLIETNGYAGPQAYLPLLENLDMAIVDLKAMDPQRHLELTGHELSPTLETIRSLYEEKKLYAVQQVVVPGFTDSDESAANTARYLAGVDPQIRLKFLRFRPHGTSGPAVKWSSPSDEVMDRLVQTALRAGLAQVERSL
jgi:pyruvate formate lyase activating enzyme